MTKKKRSKIFVLDTSVQINKILAKDIQGQIEELQREGKIFTLHLVLFEFKVSFVKLMIDYFFAIQVHGKDNADQKIADSRGRTAKYVTIFKNIVERSSKAGWETETEYLNHVEVAIQTLLVIFNNNIDGYLGSFAKDEIVQFQINSRDDYPQFFEILKKRPKKSVKIIPMTDFWERNKTALEKILSSERYQTEYSSEFEQLQKVHTKTSEVDRLSTVNTKVRDAAMVCEIAGAQTFVSLDKGHTVLCEALNKNSITLKKPVFHSSW